MKNLKSILLVITCCLFFRSEAQIKLDGYKCKYYDDQPPNLFADLYLKNDTFGFVLFSRSIMGEMETDDPKKELEIGLRLCFRHKHYIKTKDSLYIYTGKYSNSDPYIYEIYIPEAQVSLSVRSKDNDTVFSENSKWLLAQIRANRGKDMFFVNEKGQTCQDRMEDELEK